jgi:signal peptidase I
MMMASRTKAAPSAPTAAAAPDHPATLGAKIRELADELMLVFVIVMFIKLFIVELYKIPTGSMTPTLLGGTIAWIDADQDGHRDLVYLEKPENRRNPVALLFVWQDGRYVANPQSPPLAAVQLWQARGEFHVQSDRILVNKLAYWFHHPLRGEIVVFKVPPIIYRPEAPIYIKRCVGEPDDVLTFSPDGRLRANGSPVEQPEFFQTQRYEPTVDSRDLHFQPGVVYEERAPSEDRAALKQRIVKIEVPPDQAYVFGDNAQGSLDSRYWGGVPLENFKGRAFLRLWPVTQLSFLK